VFYGENVSQRITHIQAMTEGLIGVEDRHYIWQNVFAAVQPGHMSYGDVLALLPAIVHEREFHVWLCVHNGFSIIESLLDADSPASLAVRAVVSSIAGEALEVGSRR
jgi:hypothetical protein